MKSLTGIALNKHAHTDNRGLRKLNVRLLHLSADAEMIERLGNFLLECAEEMRDQKPFHRHFSDFQRGWSEEMMDVVVERSATKQTKSDSDQWPNRRTSARYTTNSRTGAVGNTPSALPRSKNRRMLSRPASP